MRIYDSKIGTFAMYKIGAKIIIKLLSIVALTGCSSASGLNLLNSVLPSTYYTLNQGVRYGEDNRQTMDIYEPSASNGTTIFFVYGGAWRSGKKKDFKFVAHALTRHGYKVVIPDYRLYPQVGFPDFVTDIADAIKQYEQTVSYTEQERFVLMGHSSGAHTAALLTTNPLYLNQAKVKTPVSALVALAGPYDLPLEDPEVAPVFPNIKDVVLVNPTKAISGKLPPVLLMHGGDDERVLIKHMYAFEEAIRQSANIVTAKVVKGGHTKIIASLARPLRFLNDSFDHLIEFLNAITPKPTG